MINSTLRCWHCFGFLQIDPKSKAIKYREVEFDGKKHKVHVGCEDRCLESIKRPTAQPTQHGRYSE